MTIPHSTYHNLFQHRGFIQSKNIAVFCNQSAFDFNQKKYLIDLLIEEKDLSAILIPEHGLFAEQQDQEKIKNRDYKGIPCISMYNKAGLAANTIEEHLTQTDALIVDIRDVGVRYYTYTNHLFQLLSIIDKKSIQIPLFIINRNNPIGSKIEGTLIKPEYASLLGEEGILHRHGMNLDKLCDWYVHKASLNLNLINIKISSHSTHFIPPSPNLPTVNSLHVYPGQCLWEATTFSEGRGTTTPFELFGHPKLSITFTQWLAMKFNRKFIGLAFLRPTSFIPTHHKHQGLICQGWQLHLEDKESYHTIFSTLFLMRIIREEFPALNFWLPGAYEFDSPLTAAQTLIGDDNLIEYVNGNQREAIILKLFKESENTWSTLDVIRIVS